MSVPLTAGLHAQPLQIPCTDLQVIDLHSEEHAPTALPHAHAARSTHTAARPYCVHETGTRDTETCGMRQPFTLSPAAVASTGAVRSGLGGPAAAPAPSTARRARRACRPSPARGAPRAASRARPRPAPPPAPPASAPRWTPRTPRLAGARARVTAQARQLGIRPHPQGPSAAASAHHMQAPAHPPLRERCRERCGLRRRAARDSEQSVLARAGPQAVSPAGRVAGRPCFRPCHGRVCPQSVASRPCRRPCHSRGLASPPCIRPRLG